MAGHSKWANIKFRKAAQDAKRGKLFTKFIREITISAKMGGPDPDTNPRLRTAIDKALSSNMTRDVIDRAIKRGAGTNEIQNLEELRYEGYGPSGVAVIVECLSDNKNRTVGEVRHAFSKHGGNLGTNGSVSFMFDKVGQVILEPGCDLDMVLDLAGEALEIEEQEDGSVLIETNPQDFWPIKDRFEKANIKVSYSEITMLPQTTVTLDKDVNDRFLKLLDMLENLDDVQEVYHNADSLDD